MIKFFGKIRQRSLTENKFRKYLIYASGEILLIMIGILLAFQVNSWNDQRKRDLLEINILKELKQNLTDDIIKINQNIVYHKRALASSQIISSVIKNDLPYSDSLDNHFTSIFKVPVFMPTASAYDILKQIGIIIITNDTLRFDITGLYERIYVFLEKTVDLNRINMVNDLSGFYRKEFSSISYFFGKSHPVNFERLIKNQEYSNYINHQKTNSKYMLDQYEKIKKINENLIINIDEELDRLD